MEDYNVRKIKNDVWYNNAKLRINEIKRKDEEMMSRDELKTLCNDFLDAIKEKYPEEYMKMRAR